MKHAESNYKVMPKTPFKDTCPDYVNYVDKLKIKNTSY